MISERLLEKHAFDRPGYMLVDSAEIALPFWRLRVRVSVQSRAPIDAFQEFSIRAIAEGLKNVDDLEGFLGIERPLVESIVADLLLTRRVRTGSNGELDLTEDGRTLLSDLTESRIEHRDLPVFFDGLLRRPVDYIGDWLEPRQLQGQALREIAPVPAQPPEIDEVRGHLADIQRFVSRTVHRNQRTEEVVALRRVERRERVFRPAIALVYRAQKARTVQVALLLDDQPAPEYDSVLSDRNFLRQFGVAKSGMRPAFKTLGRDLGTDFSEKINEDESQLLLSEVQAARTEVSAAPNDTAVVALESAESALNSLELRILATYEHVDFLKCALETAKKRLLIVSPWIRTKVVDDDFLEKIEAALERGAEIDIGWGFSKRPTKGESDEEALEGLSAISQRHRKLTVKRIGRTHAKALVCDDEFAIVTSFNWMSFRGDRKLTFRDELGVLIRTPAAMEQVFDRYSEPIRDAGTE